MRKLYKSLLISIAVILSAGYLIPVQTYIASDDLSVKEYSMTLEDIDSDVTLYRIDITSSEVLHDYAEIDYNLRVKLQNVSLRQTDEHDIINMIREECPETVTSISVIF